MARRRNSKRRRRRGSFHFLYKLLSILMICGAIVLALTWFFRVDAIEVSGQERYTQQQIRDAAGIQERDNLFLLNKYDVAGRIQTALPYVKNVRINRELPDTLVIQVEEFGTPLAVIQDGIGWLICPGDGEEARGKIVERLEENEAAGYGVISGCELLAPSVGGWLALATEYSVQQQSLLELMQALEAAGMMEQVDGIRLDDLSAIRMDYAGRFTVKMPYSADYPLKLRALQLALESEAIQDNMTGTFDMMRSDGKIHFDQSTR